MLFGGLAVKSLIAIWLFSFVLICGIALSQMVDLDPFRPFLFFLTDTLLGYIMVEVGLEFWIQKRKWKSYLVDYGIASLSAALPWMFCFLYFLIFGTGSWQENLLLSRFAAPTATGILFAMLGLAGLGMTWLFKKIEVLVIFDDLDTIFFLIPLQFLLSGGHLGLISVAFMMVVLMVIGWRYMHLLKFPTHRAWLFLYALVISTLTSWLDRSYGLEVEVLLPSFVLGLVLYHPQRGKKASHLHEHAFIEPQSMPSLLTDRSIKLLFMFLVGLLLPKIPIDTETLKNLLLHVVCITLLMNVGKLAPLFFYKKEASFRERVAVAVGMMPRGEMGAGILTIALGHGIKSVMAQAAALSLALNLFLTCFFMWIVMWLLKDKRVKE